MLFDISLVIVLRSSTAATVEVTYSLTDWIACYRHRTRHIAGYEIEAAAQILGTIGLRHIRSHSGPVLAFTTNTALWYPKTGLSDRCTAS